jgi:hypothetical protein
MLTWEHQPWMKIDRYAATEVIHCCCQDHARQYVPWEMRFHPETVKASERETMTDNKPAIRGQVEAALPPDVHILPGGKKRISHLQRDHYANHLAWAYGQGLIDDAEHTARTSYVMGNAESLGDLEEAVSDLPPVPKTPPRPPKPPQVSPWAIGVRYAVAVATAVAVAVMIALGLPAPFPLLALGAGVGYLLISKQ